MENVRPEGTEGQPVTSPSGEALGRNVYVRRSKCIRKSPQWYGTGFGSTRECKSDTVASIVYMIQYGNLNRNVDMDDILFLLAEWDSEDCMDASSTFHTRESYVLKYKRHDPDTPIYMEALSVEHADEYYEVMDDETQILMRRETWDIISRNSVDDINVILGTWYFKHRMELPGNYPVLTVVMVICHYIERIWRIIVTPNLLYNI